jgi:predicted DNA-binding WGR domain protein
MIRLEHTTGGHHKYYEFHKRQSNGRVVIIGYYGAIGQAPKEAIIYDGDSEAEARKELDRKQNEKLRKGYVVVSEGQTSALEHGSKKKNP